MLLRLAAVIANLRFADMGIITFDFFHLLMNFQELIYKHLFKDASKEEPCTAMMGQKNRRSRHEVEQDGEYDTNKDFFKVSFQFYDLSSSF